MAVQLSMFFCITRPQWVNNKGHHPEKSSQLAFIASQLIQSAAYMGYINVINKALHSLLKFWLFLSEQLILNKSKNNHIMVIFWHYSSKHPNLGWLYVFSSFPPRPQPPPPPSQQLLSLMSKPFELNLSYLAQRICETGEMCWMTFWWPWRKVMAVASISKNLLVCRVKWEPLIGSLQNMPHLVPYLIQIWRSSVGNFYLGKFSLQISDVFFQGQTLFSPYLRNGW